MCFYFAWHWTWHGRFWTANTFRIHLCWRKLLSFHKMDLIWSYCDNSVLRIQNLHQDFVELWPAFKHSSAQFSILVRDVNKLSSLQGRSTDCTESGSNNISFVHLSYIVIVKENRVCIFAGRFAFDCLNHAGIKIAIFPRGTDAHTKKRIFWSSSGGKHNFFLDGCRTILLFLVRNRVFSRVTSEPVKRLSCKSSVVVFTGVFGGVYHLWRDLQPIVLFDWPKVSWKYYGVSYSFKAVMRWRVIG